MFVVYTKVSCHRRFSFFSFLFFLLNNTSWRTFRIRKRRTQSLGHCVIAEPCPMTPPLPLHVWPFASFQPIDSPAGTGLLVPRSDSLGLLLGVTRGVVLIFSRNSETASRSSHFHVPSQKGPWLPVGGSAASRSSLRGVPESGGQLLAGSWLPLPLLQQ